MRLKTAIITALCFSANLPLGVFANSYQDSEPDYSEYHPVVNMGGFADSPNMTADSLTLVGDWAQKNGNFMDALKLYRRAMKKDGDNIEVHLGLAMALESKLKSQDERDEVVFKECLKEWLAVFRNEYGEEKGISDKDGRSLPGIQGRYEDPEHGGLARAHIKALVGSVPGPREKDAHFMQRVLSPANSTVTGKLVTSGRNKQQ
jgi:hypothetical protein